MASDRRTVEDVKKFLLPLLIILVVVLLGFVGILITRDASDGSALPSETISTDREIPALKESQEFTQKELNEPALAFIYQNVGDFKDGASEIAIRLGISVDGETVQSYGRDVLTWTVSSTVKDSYGDPVMSRLSDGNWAMTAWTGMDDSRGAGILLYHESACPFVEDEDVIVITPSNAAGCSNTRSLTGGKSSQVFEADDGNYVFHMISGEVYLAHLSDPTHSALDLETMCVLESTVSELSDLNWGESTRILSKDETGLLLSDTAIARRADGTWVLFAKGREQDNDCAENSVCELCHRSIYRTTSMDLIHWSELEEVVGEASVPEATQTVDGTVWVYWQDFDAVCEQSDMKVSSRAPISGAYEMEGSYELSEPVQVSFPDEDFETNKNIHYATNANPVMLPDVDAQEAYEACAAK